MTRSEIRLLFHEKMEIVQSLLLRHQKTGCSKPDKTSCQVVQVKSTERSWGVFTHVIWQKIWNKVRSICVKCGIHHLSSKYGRKPYYTELLAILYFWMRSSNGGQQRILRSSNESKTPLTCNAIKWTKWWVRGGEVVHSHVEKRTMVWARPLPHSAKENHCKTPYNA